MPCTRTSRVKDSLRKFVAKTLGPISKSDMTNSDKGNGSVPHDHNKEGRE